MNVWKLLALLMACVLLTACVGPREVTVDNTADGGTSHRTTTTTAAVTTTTTTDNASLPETVFADIDMAGYGVITVQLEGRVAPVTVANFVKLAESGFYDGLTFHRIINGFMMQGGNGGYARPAEPIVGEFSSNGHPNPLLHTRGAISMARTDDPNSADSQFFIVHQDSDWLDGDYAVFGYVINGMDIVDTICAQARPYDGDGSILPKDQPVINSVTIRYPQLY